MKRSTFEGRTLVYKYAAPARWDGARVDLTEHATGHLRLAHELRNRLVELWRAHEDAKATLWLTRPEVAEAAAYLEDTERTLEKLAEEIRQAKRRRQKIPPPLAAAAKDARARRRDLKADHKAARGAALEMLGPEFSRVLGEHVAAKKALYAEYVQQGDLYWPTFNVVLRDMDTAARKIVADRTAGRPAQLRFARWDGTGRLAVQLQREAADPPPTPEAIEGGLSKWRNHLRISPVPAPGNARPGQRTDRMRLVSLRVGSADREPIWQHVPVVWHRDLPADAEIKAVVLVRQRTAGTHRLAVCITIRLPSPAQTGRQGVAELTAGLRVDADGSALVAEWTGQPDHPIAVPAHLKEMVTAGEDGGQVRIPAVWFTGGTTFGQTRVDDLGAIRAQEMERLRRDLLADPWWDEDIAQVLDVTKADITRWRSPARFAALSLKARTSTDVPAGIRLMLEKWRVQDRHLWEWQGHQGKRVAQRRRDLYRNVAAILVSSYGRIGIVEAPTDPPADDDEAARRAWYGKAAAVGELTAAVRAAAARDGIPIGGDSSEPEASGDTPGPS